MTSLIEQAARRLQQLRESGIDIPDVASPPVATRPMDPAAPFSSLGRETVSVAATPHMPDGPAPLASSAPVAFSKHVELDLTKLAGRGVLVPNAPRSHIADQFRVIKRPLIANAMGRGAARVTHGNLIMLTSALPGEGKTFSAVNLAMSIAAELDHTVMLVDADVARPSVLKMLELPSAPGLLELLEGKAQMQDVLLRTNVEKLTVLPSGRPHPKATELLASDAMRQLLDDMASRYPDRIIIFDSPPLLLTTEARVLATQMGQVVLVVHAGRTLQADVQHALTTIESCPIRMMLLNKANTAVKESYGYGYGYGYGADGSAPSTEGYGYGYGAGYGSGYGSSRDTSPSSSAEPAAAATGKSTSVETAAASEAR